MKKYWFHLIAAFWLMTQSGLQALDPTEVDGFVSVEVDRSKAVWEITIANHSSQKLSYEMMGKVPRGLGMELWEPDVSASVIRLHAGDLAQYLGVDGFPADIREILPGKAQVFQLDPRSMSTTDATTFAKWKRAERMGYYDCRVVFGIYASRLISVSPEDKPANSSKVDQPKITAIEDSNEGGLFGIRLRRILNEKGLALVSWHRGSDRKGEYHISYTTCAKADLGRMASWDGSKAVGLELHPLVTRAHEIARQKIAGCGFDGLIIDPCEDDGSKFYASIYFSDDQEDIVINLLLNGSPTETTRLSLTQEQYQELAEYEIPNPGGQAGAGQPTARPVPDSGGGDKPQPEAERRSR